MKFVRLLPIFVAGLIAGSAGAEGFPNRPVHLVVPYTAGSGQDVLARAVALRLAELWGQQVLVENRPGAGGSVGTATVAKAPPDGYTLLWNSNAFAANAALYASLPYDPVRDFVAVTPVLRQPLVLVTGAAAGAKSVSELVAKGKGERLSYGSAGTGTGTHFAAEKFRLATGIEAVHVPYKGAEVNTDVIAGRVTYWFAPIVVAAPHVREGRLKALAVTSTKRSVHLQDVPTLAEAGVSGADYSLWSGIWAPVGTPGDMVEKVGQDVARVVADPAFREKLDKMGAEPLAMRPAEFQRLVHDELASAARVAQAARIKAE